MAILQFIPTSSMCLTISAKDDENSVIHTSVKMHKSEVGIQLDNGELLDVSGELSIYRGYSEIGQKLKSKGFVGVLTYFIDDDRHTYDIELHISEEKFDQIIQIVSVNKNLKQFSIETPLSDPNLRSGLRPDGPNRWNVNDQIWVRIESCDFTFGLIDENDL